MASTIKSHAAFKTVLPKGDKLDRKILDTLKTVAEVVGGTLGPCGRPVLIERSEDGIPPVVTKDGVTVFRALGFEDATSQCLLEVTRDASVRTADSAGDGTTTATILAEAFVRHTLQYCKDHKSLSPAKVVREIQATFQNVMRPELERLAVKYSLDDEGLQGLWNVANISANGDSALADAVIDCYQICGDDGNITVADGNDGQGSRYEPEKIEGYPIAMGYESSCGRLFPIFINRQDTQQCVLDRPIFILYFGRLNESQSAIDLLNQIQTAWENHELATPNVVFVATGFSDQVVADFAGNWLNGEAINVFPLACPDSPQTNGSRNFMDDLAAVTAATVFDPITKKLETATLGDLGNIELKGVENPETLETKYTWEPRGVKHFECSRYRSSIVGFADEEILIARQDVVRARAEHESSTLDAVWTRERLAKLTGGIARLKVMGSSGADISERRDRADDAICAVRGAIKYGTLVGGGWALARLAMVLPQSEVNSAILRPALLRPAETLFANAGFSTEESRGLILPVLASTEHGDPNQAVVYDLNSGRHVRGLAAGLLDSYSAVFEALKNSISLASLLGTLGGTIVHPRDKSFDMQDAKDAAEFARMMSVNPADERP